VPAGAGLERVDAYVIDLHHLQSYPVRAGLVHLGSRIHYTAAGPALAVAGIEYDGQTIPPGHSRWEFHERIALAGLLTHFTVWPPDGLEHRTDRCRHVREVDRAHFVAVWRRYAEPADGALLLFTGESPAVATRFPEADPYVRATGW